MFKVAWILTVGMMILKIIGIPFMAAISWWAVFAPIPLVTFIWVCILAVLFVVHCILEKLK